MKRKAIEKIPWQSEGEKEKMVVAAKVHNIGGEDVLIVDFALEKPVIRIAMSHNDFENYVPEESPCKNAPKWGRRQYRELRRYHDFYLPQIRNFKLLAYKETADIIHKFVYGENDKFQPDWNSDIEQLQSEIIYEKYDQAEYRRFERIKKIMAAVPEPTEGFRKWAVKFVEEHIMYMLPFKKKKTTKASCTACRREQEFERGKIKPKQIITCPSCGAKCTVKRVDYENKNPVMGYLFKREVLLFQRIGEEFCERHFLLENWVDMTGEHTDMVEIGRIFYPVGSYNSDWTGDEFKIKGKERIYYNKYNPWEGTTFWDDKNLSGMANIVLRNGSVYPRTINKKMFEDTRYRYCAMELISKEEDFAPIAYLKKFDRFPRETEMLVKMGLFRLALEYNDYELLPPSKEKCKPWERLGITKKQIIRLQKINGGYIALKWMNYEEATGKTVDDEAIKFFERERIKPKDIDFISDRLSGRKIMNYIIRQHRQYKLRTGDILILWRDYLSMALRMKMDVKQELIFKPKDIKKAHDDIVKLCGGADAAKRAGEIIQNYPDVDEIMKSIKAKYEYSDEKYSIIVPEKIEDIIYEGRKLGHCLDKSDIYFDRIQRRESFIVFLRKTEDIEKPYYTLEIEPDGTTRQKRTTGDRQNKDFGEAVEFIRKWQSEVKKRLNKEDKVLAAQSAELREKEFEQLRKNQTKIWHGALAGQLLADVLEADLMTAN